MKVLIKALVVLSIILSCCQLTKEGTYLVKNELISNDACENDNRYGYLVLAFTYRYSMDTLAIYVNDTLYKTTYLKTDDVPGHSQTLEIDRIKNIENAEFRINHKNNVNIPFDTVNQMFLISKLNDTITLKSVCSLPNLR